MKMDAIYMCGLLLAIVATATAQQEQYRILVKKSERTLYLYRQHNGKSRRR